MIIKGKIERISTFNTHEGYDLRFFYIYRYSIFSALRFTKRQQRQQLSDLRTLYSHIATIRKSIEGEDDYGNVILSNFKN